MVTAVSILAMPSSESEAIPSTKEILAKSIAAMGGMEGLRNTKKLSYHSVSHTFLRSAVPA